MDFEAMDIYHKKSKAIPIKIARDFAFTEIKGADCFGKLLSHNDDKRA